MYDHRKHMQTKIYLHHSFAQFGITHHFLTRSDFIYSYYIKSTLTTCCVLALTYLEKATTHLSILISKTTIKIIIYFSQFIPNQSIHVLQRLRNMITFSTLHKIPTYTVKF